MHNGKTNDSAVALRVAAMMAVRGKRIIPFILALRLLTSFFPIRC
jgi:hypothetical protein